MELVVDGAVHELPPPRSLLRLFGPKPTMTLSEVRALGHELVSDPKATGLLVTLRSFDAGMATALALRDALASVAGKGKRVVVHLSNGVDTKGYFIASAGDRVTAFPGSSIGLLGFASQAFYVRGALEKAGVVAEVLARGRYKSAGESLTRDAMSPEQREQVGALLDAMAGAVKGALVNARKLTPVEAAAVVDRALYRAPEAVEARLLDAALFDDEVKGSLALGEGDPPRIVAAGRYLRARRATRLFPRGKSACIGVVRVHGVIASGKGAPGGSGAFSDAILGAIRAARAERRVKAVIVHIDSPGGSALASAQMHRELELLAAEKPLVACMANVAASGGYYVAAPAHRIVAEPLTVTGSIGVVSARFAFGPILERLGVLSDVEKRGARADLYSPTRRLHDDERAAILAEIEGTYREFVEVVARGRNKSFAEVDAVAEGRVWSGADAKARGLVDDLGGFEVALAEARRRAGDAGLEARVVRPGQGEMTVAMAEPRKAAELLLPRGVGPWAVLAGVVAKERVVLWSPEAMELG